MKCQNNLYSFQNKLEGGTYSWGVFILVVFFVTGTDNSVLGGVYFSQISVIYFTWDLAAVCIIGVSASRELTVHGPISGRMNKQGGGVLISSSLPFL